MSLSLRYFSGGPRERVFAAIIREGHIVERVYVNDPQRWPRVTPTIELARMNAIDVRVIRTKAELAELYGEIDGKLCFSAGFNYLFDRDFIGRARCCLNVHGSLLPKYPGARTLAWVIENGETQGGVSVHVIDEGIDTGAILLQRAFELSPFETTRSLARKISEFEPSVVIDALRIYERSGTAAARRQRSRQLSKVPNRNPVHSELNPNLPLVKLINKIRAADPDDYPAYFFYHGEKVCVRYWRPTKPPDEVDLI